MSSTIDILANIQSLQDTEEALITQLDIATSSSNFNVSDTTNIINQINNLSNARIAMFQSISDKADMLQDGISNSRTDLVAQLTLLRTVEDQLSKAKEGISQIQGRNDTQMRLVQVNTYYGKRYESQSNLMKKIIIICIPLLVFVILKKKGFIPETLSNYAIGITIAVGAIFIIRAIWDIYTRDNNDFDEYSWNYESPATQIPSVMQYNISQLKGITNPLKNLASNLGICVGETCCAEGLYFDKKKQQCTVPKTTDNVTQGFQSGGLKGSIVNKFSDDNDDNDDGIKPFSFSSDYGRI